MYTVTSVVGLREGPSSANQEQEETEGLLPARDGVHSMRTAAWSLVGIGVKHAVGARPRKMDWRRPPVQTSGLVALEDLMQGLEGFDVK